MLLCTNAEAACEVKEDYEEELGGLCRDFENMRIHLKEAIDDKMRYDRDTKELISNISHDLKTPLTTIKGYVEGILDGVADSPDKMDRYLKTVYNKANDMERLIGEYIHLEIEDNGQGVSPEEAGRIFERFYRTDASRNSRTGGSGIGLSIVKKIVEAHGGTIWAVSNKNVGLTMHILLRKEAHA